MAVGNNWKKAIMAHLRGLSNQFTKGKAQTQREFQDS
jgi:hypothetical protein